MPEPKRTGKSRSTGRRRPQPKIAEPPVVEPLPLHREFYYAGLGLADLAAEGLTRVTSQLRLLEKQLVARGQKRSVGLDQQIGVTREELTRRGQEFQQTLRRSVREMWSALRGSDPDADRPSSAAPGTA